MTTASKEVRAFAKHIKSKSARVLDIGCGKGQNVAFLAEQGFEVTAIDNSFNALSVTIKKLKTVKAQHKPKTLFMDAENLDLKNDSFDAIIDNGTFHFLRKSAQKKYIGSVYKALSQQGLLFLSVFSKEDPLSETKLWHQYFSEEEIKKLFKKFKVQKIKKLEKKGRQKKKFLIFWLAKE